jgi:hypothetical protein
MTEEYRMSKVETLFVEYRFIPSLEGRIRAFQNLKAGVGLE